MNNIKALFVGLLTISGLICGSNLGAEEYICSDKLDSERSRCIADFDFLLLRPHLSDGFDSPDEFGLETSYRFRLAYETKEGVGLRSEFWQFRHSQSAGPDNREARSVETYNLDFGLYKKLGLGRGSKVEISGGFRYNDFNDNNFSDFEDRYRFGGAGGFFGLHAWQELGCEFRGYARVKWAMLYDGNTRNDYDDEEVRFDYNTTRTQQELALGVERCASIGHCLATLRVGAEFLNLQEYEDDSEGDIGFSGLCLGITLCR